MKRTTLAITMTYFLLQPVVAKEPANIAKHKNDNITIIEIDRDKSPITIKDGHKYVITNKKRSFTTAIQIIHNGKLIFPVERGLKEKTLYIYESNATETDTLVCGAHYPERVDDIAWENNLTAYRAYGPALQRSGEKAYGYDIWTKSVEYPVVKERYHKHLNKGISYHEDHGNGMDVYAVGPTLGGGTAALYIDSTIIYPYCWSEYEILDNGPWRFSVKLKYKPFIIGENSIQEIRTITLDYGTYLNKCTVQYAGNSTQRDIVAGIVIHDKNPQGYYLDKKREYIAVEDSTQNNRSGAIYVGIKTEKKFRELFYKPYNKPGEIKGHVLALDRIDSDNLFTYYWGSSWSKNGITFSAWKNYLKRYHKNRIKKIKLKQITTL